MNYRIQKLPPVLWTNKPLDDRNSYVFSYVNGVKMVTKMDTPKAAFDAIKKAESKGIAAFASAPIPCNNNQHGVFAFSTAGCTKEYASAKNVCEMVNNAHNSIFTNTKTEPKKVETPVQKIASPKKTDRNDPMRIIVVVNYFGSEKKYNFRCRKWHLPGEMVCVHTFDEYKNVEVIECKTMKESEVKELAKSIGYDDISEVYCDEPIQLEEEYHEDIAELRAMREAFAPVCDYAPANRDGYIYEEQDNYEPEDFDDLPD